MQEKHPSHQTRSSDASSFDEVCVICGATDISGGGWGRLAEPCAPVIEETTFAEVAHRIREGRFFEDYDWASGPGLRALSRAEDALSTINPAFAAGMEAAASIADDYAKTDRLADGSTAVVIAQAIRAAFRAHDPSERIERIARSISRFHHDGEDENWPGRPEGGMPLWWSYTDLAAAIIKDGTDHA